MSAFYNEIDPKAAAWLRELIAEGLIAPGHVDERDVRDITPDELRPFRQCHFFAGIGGWSLALRRSGWEDDRPVWTASCPCQPFSAAGGRSGFADERHLWPAFYHLASQCRPHVVLGEQVASSDGLHWIDLVSADMEAAGYSGGALDLCSAGFGAPNIRQRLYFVWMADAADFGHERAGGTRRRRDGPANDGAACGLDDTTGARLVTEGQGAEGEARDLARLRVLGDGCDAGGLAHPGSQGPSQLSRRRDEPAGLAPPSRPHNGRPLPTNGFWRDADWLLCRDDGGPAWRPVRPGSFPLAPSLPGRVALLRGAGNAINAEVAAGFIAEVMEMIETERLAA